MTANYRPGDTVAVVFTDTVKSMDRNGYVVLTRTGDWAVDNERVLSIMKVAALPTAAGSVVRVALDGPHEGELRLLCRDGFWMNEDGDKTRLASRDAYDVIFDAGAAS